MKQGITLLSETDPKGIIILANDAFCDISKYSREELVGQPHNIIRHPDMPKKFFEIFWATIQRGETFRGIIKNRAKDGSHYWVNATIIPVTDNEDRIIKIVSARYLIEDNGHAQDLYNEQVELLGLDHH